MLLRVFLDASVLFSAAYSARGAARELLLLGKQSKVQLFFSGLVLEETLRNLIISAPQKQSVLNKFLRAASFQRVEPTKSDILAAARYTELKDAAIVAAALCAKADYLATFDRQHLINPPEVSRKSGLAIVTPDAALKAVRRAARSKAA